MPDKTIDIGDCLIGKKPVKSVLEKIEEEAENRATVVHADSKLISLIDNKVGIGEYTCVSGYENLEIIPEAGIDDDTIKLYFEEKYCLHCPNDKMYNAVKGEYYCPACDEEKYKDKSIYKKERIKRRLPFKFTEAGFIDFCSYLVLLSFLFWFVIDISLHLL
jgi:hypothetical protein